MDNAGRLTENERMKFLFDIFPVVLFFAAFKFFGVFVATAVAIVATISQVAWVRLRHGKVDNMLWVSLGVIVVFGGLTLVLQDEVFIKWKPTILYWLFAAALLAGQYGFRRNLIRAMMEKQMSLPDAVWLRLMLSWVGFFLVMGGLNLYVAFSFSLDTWVNFKLFGGMGLMLVFVVIQAMMISRHIETKQP
jgi:intracellular septation protein